ncbi:auxin-induced protein IAA6-like [Silene latifolia]|uniref:auxin-induced protein IAA6-like n=1 Tax=Silene latifolia TaxID=37657 RepID=UPI003D76C03B
MASLGFELEITELRLGLPGGIMRRISEEKKTKKRRVFSEVEKGNVGSTTKNVTVVVGWPPVCSHRRKSFESERDNGIEASKRLVKISMDGVPFLRKVDLNGFKDYSRFVASLEKLFGCSGLENVSVKHMTKEALEEYAENCEYVLIYEDKDGDWLLVGDVPWRLFIESCKRLRIMKSENVKSFQMQCTL